MFLLKIHLSCLISKLSLISRTNLLLPFAKMVNSSKDGMLLKFERWSRIVISFDGLVFSNVTGDIPVCSPELTFNPFQDGLFRGCSWMGEGQQGPPP